MKQNDKTFSIETMLQLNTEQDGVETENERFSARIDATGMITDFHGFRQSSRELYRHQDLTSDPMESPNETSDATDDFDKNTGNGGNGAQNQLQEVQQRVFEQLLQSPEGQAWLQGLIRNAMEPTMAPYSDVHRSYEPEDMESYQAMNGAGIADAEEGDGRKFPQDAYSILALNGPTGNDCWPKRKVLFFLFGLMPFLFQLSLLGLLLSHLDFRTTKEMMENLDIDTSCAYVRSARVVALLAYMVFPSSTQQDLITSIQLYPWCTTEAENIPIGCIRMSCILRGIQGHSALFVVFLLIMQSNNTLDIILNFTAVNFISDLDDAAFSLAKSGIFGRGLQKETKRIATTMLPECIYRESKHIWHMAIMVGYAAVLFTVMIYLMVFDNEAGYFWITRILVDYIGTVLLLYIIARSCCAICCALCPGRWNRGSSSEEEDDDAAAEEGEMEEEEEEAEEASDKNCIGSSERTARTAATNQTFDPDQTLKSIQELPDV